MLFLSTMSWKRLPPNPLAKVQRIIEIIVSFSEKVFEKSVFLSLPHFIIFSRTHKKSNKFFKSVEFCSFLWFKKCYFPFCYQEKVVTLKKFLNCFNYEYNN